MAATSINQIRRQLEQLAKSISVSNNDPDGIILVQFVDPVDRRVVSTLEVRVPNTRWQ
jgi:hypothetical protein